MSSISIPNLVPIGVGFDTARYGHHVTFLREDRQPATKAFSFTESREGYQQLQTALEKLGQQHGGRVHFHLRIDAAGQYAANLEQFLRSLPYSKTISVGEPARNKNYRQAHFPKRKADPVESEACARFAIVERPAATPHVPAEFYPLREVASRLQSKVKQTTRLVNQLHNLLSRVFPELAVLASKLSARWVVQLLESYPTAEKIAAAPLASLTAIPYLSQAKAEAVQAAARQTTGAFRGDVAAQLVRQLVRELRQSQKAQKSLQKLLKKAYAALPASHHVHLESIKGIGPGTAAVLVAKMVSIDRFDSAEHLAGYFGIFPEENTSGVDKHGKPIPPGTMRMSKKGNDLVRKYLWMAARSASSHNPAVRPLYARLRARGTRGDVALGHCMRKLLHLVFAVWKTGQPFDPQHYPWDARTPRQPAAETPVAQRETVGRNKGQEPERKAVTTASSKVEPSAAPVNSPSPERQTAAAPAPSTERVDFADLRQRVTMQQVLGHLGLLDRLRGGKVQRRGPCPIHGAACDRTRSFSVNLRKNVFKCFHPPCGAQGNVLDFWAAVHHLPLREAALHMKNVFHLEQHLKQPEQR